MRTMRFFGRKLRNWFPPNPFFCWKSARSDGFTLIEVMMVIALIAVTYVVALPNLGVRKESAVVDQLSEFVATIKNVFDETVLSGKPHRLVFHFASGNYWLEVTESKDFRIGLSNPTRDLNPEEEKAAQEEFKESFKKYEDLLGTGVTLPTSDNGPIKPQSPVIKAQKALAGVNWTRIDSMEWKNRTMGDFLIIRKMQTEHLEAPVSLDDGGKDAIGVLYFFPNGYVERAFWEIYYRGNDDLGIDPNQKPYTIATLPYQGVAEVESGIKEIDVKESAPSEEESQ